MKIIIHALILGLFTLADAIYDYDPVKVKTRGEWQMYFARYHPIGESDYGQVRHARFVWKRWRLFGSLPRAHCQADLKYRVIQQLGSSKILLYEGKAPKALEFDFSFPVDAVLHGYNMNGQNRFYFDLFSANCGNKVYSVSPEFNIYQTKMNVQLLFRAVFQAYGDEEKMATLVSTYPYWLSWITKYRKEIDEKFGFVPSAVHVHTLPSAPPRKRLEKKETTAKPVMIQNEVFEEGSSSSEDEEKKRQDFIAIGNLVPKNRGASKKKHQ